MEVDARTQQELLKREQRYWTAVKQRDSETATALSDDPCLVVGAQGVGELSREQLGGMLDSATYELERFQLENVHALRVSDDVVVLAYKVNEALKVDGEEVRLDAYDSSVWVKRNGDWVCALHTESPAGDPFGRH
jgi:hypothetical protein